MRILYTLIPVLAICSTPLFAEQPKAPPPSEHTVMVIEQRPVTIEKELPGRIVANKVAEIRPQISGIITDLLFDEGKPVKKGQQLYQIDPAPYQAAYNSTVADLAKAKANVSAIEAKAKRYHKLVKIKAISQQEYDDIQASLANAKANVQIAEAAVARAKIDLNYTKVYAPISGFIGTSQVTTGALVTTGQAQALTTIVQLDPIKVDMTIPMHEFISIRSITPDLSTVPIRLQTGTGNQRYPHQGKILFHDVSVATSTGTIQLRGQVPNPDALLMPGLFVRAYLQLPEPNAMLIPQRVAQRQPDGSLQVWVMDKNYQAQPRSITAQQNVGGDWIIESGLNNDDVVITDNLMRLRPGATVTPNFPKR
jgi:membrane fusion protein, multidrug efflux system